MSRLILIFIVISLFVSSAACSRTPEMPKTHTAVEALCDAEINLPAGTIYSTDFEADSPQYLSCELLASYFGVPDIEKYSKDFTSCSIFLPSGRHACEFAVIYCSNPDSLVDTARLLQARIDSAKRYHKSDFSDYLSGARVITRKNLAVLIISNDPDMAIKVLKKAT